MIEIGVSAISVINPFPLTVIVSMVLFAPPNVPEVALTVASTTGIVAVSPALINVALPDASPLIPTVTEFTNASAFFAVPSKYPVSVPAFKFGATIFALKAISLPL